MRSKRTLGAACAMALILFCATFTSALPFGTATAKGTVPKKGAKEAEVKKQTGTGTMEVTHVEVKAKDGTPKRVSYTVKGNQTTSPTVVFDPALVDGDQVTVTLTTSRGTTFELGLTFS